MGDPPKAPKCLFITWLLMHEKLATCHYLLKIGVSVDPVCCLCEHESETLDHLFFECDFSKNIWNGVAGWCGIIRQVDKWSVEKGFLTTKCTTNSGK